MILLVMQSLDNKIRLSLKNGPLGSRLTSNQDSDKPNPTYIPVANEAARVAANAIDGYPASALNEVVLDTPTTAHIIGGACIGVDRQSGVIDAYQRLYGHEGLHVADSSAITGNLGVNPALTITAMTERAMAHWPNKGEPDPRPPLGAPYVPVAIQPPRHPTVPADAPATLRIY